MKTATRPHCVLTGSSSGIGLALTQRLLVSGWRVSGLDVCDSQPREYYQHFLGDLTDMARLPQLCQDLLDEEITALVHCAGAM
jgi:3-oxoacyl-[acyl-carrier protein] reductase